MKLRIQKDHFFNGLQQIVNIVGTRPSMPILNNVLLQTAGDSLSLTTTNLDIAISCSVHAEIISEGAITLPARKLATIVRALPQNEVLIEVSEQHQAKITSGGSIFKIMGMGVEEFPSPNLPSEGHKAEVSSPVLQSMLKSVAYAQSTDPNRYILNGIYFHFDAGQLSLVATDGRRLALVSTNATLGEEGIPSIILPAKAANELMRILGQGEEVGIHFNARQVLFCIKTTEESTKTGLVGNITLTSKVVEGQFPNYKQVIPKETAHRIRIERELFLDCIERASFVASDRHNAVKMKMSPNLLEISGSSSEVGEAHESMAIAYEGPEVQVSFNPQFLMDPLKALNYDEVAFEFKDELSPGLIKTNDSFLCVVMPLRSN